MRNIKVFLSPVASAFLLILSLAGTGRTSSGQKKNSATHFQITGIVLNARDGNPLPHCHMRAAVADGSRGGDDASADTDETGHFLIDLPGAGNYQLSAQARGFRSQFFDEHDGFFTGVVLTRASPTYNLTFSAIPDARIRGTVTDESGEPVRNAAVTLFSPHPEAKATGANPMQTRASTQTDDRGHYQFASLETGAYELSVRATPWYATPGRPAGSNGATAPPDPSLDVVYPLTWFPGVDDPAAADILPLHPGEAVEADLRLRPMASAHLLIPLTSVKVQVSEGGNQRETPVLLAARVSEIMPDGSVRQVAGSSEAVGDRGLDIGGLAPGTYQVSQRASQPGLPEQNAEIRITSGGSVSEVSGATNEVSVTIAIDGVPSASASEISLADTTTGRVFNGDSDRFLPEDGTRGGQRGGTANPRRGRNGQAAGIRRGDDTGPRGRRRPGGDTTTEAHLTVPPGSYTLLAPPSGDIFLTGVSAQGAEVNGRVVTIQGGSPKLTVHLANGLARVEGFALLDGKPSSGAMVLLVPATLGQPSNLTNVRRDQTNTDGSFDLEKVVPGQYILVAIDSGWKVNWSDAATLRPYLMHGVPLDLKPAATIHSSIQASVP